MVEYHKNEYCRRIEQARSSARKRWKHLRTGRIHAGAAAARAISGKRRVDPLQRDAEVDAQIGLLVLVWKPATGVRCDHVRAELGIERRGHEGLAGGAGGQERQPAVGNGFRRACARSGLGECVDSMPVRRYLAAGQGHVIHAKAFPEEATREPRPLSLLAGAAPSQVGQLERGLAVAAIGGSDQGEQRRVL